MKEGLKEYLPAIITLIAGTAIIFMAKQSFKGFLYDMQKIFVTRAECERQLRFEAEEREAARKNTQNHEERLTAAGA
jgi:hypothetical protein